MTNIPAHSHLSCMEILRELMSASNPGDAPGAAMNYKCILVIKLMFRAISR